MKKQNYSELLKDPRWQKKRLEIMQRDEFKCKFCGDKKTQLHVHHKKYEYNKNPWDSSLSDLITLCEHCHKEIEFLKTNNYNVNDLIIINKQICNGDRYITTAVFKNAIHIGFYNSEGELEFGPYLNAGTIKFLLNSLKQTIYE